MKRNPNKNYIYIFLTISLVVMAIVTTALINAVRGDQGSQTDIRAKAGVANTLSFKGVVAGIDDIAGTVTVEQVEFSETSRSGSARNFGTWTITPPPQFQLGSVVVGQGVNFTIDAKSFNVSSHKADAVKMELGN